MNEQKPSAEQQAFLDRFKVFQTLVELGNSGNADAMNLAKQALVEMLPEMTAGMVAKFQAMAEVFAVFGQGTADEYGKLPDEMLESIVGLYMAAVRHVPALDEAVGKVNEAMGEIGL
ncbi:hypothetical protein [Actinomadura verrucosospora]|uniref:Cytosolic protein n=1 Tax=Actinomadura verrucosospora TaxID=46165 RepID=A0A7D3ZMB2_ACTVE|nr:hypothetical protein [Actinomadura verrucosospora]QKG23701.1 cytosolic protein [Actinomadura verrucosospora]